MARAQKGTTDMTQGSPAKLIFFFALPLLAGNVFQQLYNMVDSMVVGNFVSDAALAAVGTGFPVIFMLSALFMGIGMGATVMISQYYGAEDMKNVNATIGTIYTAMMIGAIPLTLAGFFLAGPLLHLMQVPADTFPMAQTYVRIVFLGIIGNLGFNVNSGILQGLGNSKTPLLFLAVACVINIILDLVFVIVFQMGVAGVALATIIAQFCSWMFGVVYIGKKYPELHIRPFAMIFHKDLFVRAVKLGIPAGIQQALFSVGVMVLQSLVNGFGTSFIAGFQGANKIDTFGFMPIQSFATAVTTYVGQNIGAGRLDRVKKGTHSALWMSVLCSVCMAALVMPLSSWAMRLFSQDPAVIAAGCAYLYRIMPFYSVFALMFVLNSVMRGAGEMTVPMLSTLLSLWLVRVPSAYLMVEWFGRDAMFFCYVIGWVAGLAIAGGYYLTGRWKSRAITQNLVKEQA